MSNGEFFRWVWSQVEGKTYPFAYGFYKGRRREQAILIQNTTAWRISEYVRQLPVRKRSEMGMVITLRGKH